MLRLDTYQERVTLLSGFDVFKSDSLLQVEKGSDGVSEQTFAGRDSQQRTAPIVAKEGHPLCLGRDTVLVCVTSCYAGCVNRKP